LFGGDQDVVLTMKGVPESLTRVRTLGDVPGWLQSRTAQPVAGTCPTRSDESAERHRALPWWERCSRRGSKFNPPIRVQLPNTDGLAPGQVTEIFSFHHDLEQFVSEGTARVSSDGSVMVSDPGSADGFGLARRRRTSPAADLRRRCEPDNDCNTASAKTALRPDRE